MDRLRGSRRLLVVAGALFAVLALAVGPAGAREPDPNVGGTAVIGSDFDPPCLNYYLVGCGFSVSRQVTAAVLAGAYRQRPDFTFEPVLVDRVTVSPETSTSWFKLTYRLERDAEWSDGTPVTAHDLAFTLETLLDPSNDILTREGYDRIIRTTILDDKTVRFSFDRPYAAWKPLFPLVLPKHVLEGKDFDTVWHNGIVDPETGEPIGSGPFLFESWDRGVSLTLSRNPNWWGSDGANLDSLVYRFVPFGQSLAPALLNGTVDVITTQVAQPTLAGAPGIDLQTAPAAQYEHVDFNVGSETMPLLGHQWFREAVTYALDRKGAVAVGSTAGNIPNLGVLQSRIYISQHPEYEEHFSRYSYDPERVSRIMRRHGCVLGGDGVWSCEGTRASIKLATTTGNVLRLAAQAHLRTAAQAAGIELVPDNDNIPTLFGQRLPAGDYEAIMFAFVWLGDPNDHERFLGCGGDQNFLGYCSEPVTRLLQTTSEEANESRRQSYANDADEILAEDLVSIPVMQRASLLYSGARLRGVEINPTEQALTWNVEDWWVD